MAYLAIGGVDNNAANNGSQPPQPDINMMQQQVEELKLDGNDTQSNNAENNSQSQVYKMKSRREIKRE